MAICHVVPNWLRTPITKFHFLMFLFDLAHAGRQKILIVTLKSSPKYVLKHFLSLQPGGNVQYSLIVLKQNMKRHSTKFPLCPGRNLFTLRTYKINSKQILISNFLFGNCSLKKKEDICRFSHKYLFISPCGFF